MQLVKISEFFRSKRDVTPQITFSTKGVIRINKLGLKTMALPKTLEHDFYLHFAFEGQKEDHKLYAWIDNNPVEGLKLRRKSGFGATEVDQHVCNAANLISHFKDTFDWPLAKDKKPTIKYDVQPEIIITDFSDRVFRLS